MDALREWMESDLDVIMESDLDFIMVGPWMLGVLGWGLSGRYYGWPMHAIMAGPRMLCVNGWGLSGRFHGSSMDALRNDECLRKDKDSNSSKTRGKRVL